MQLINVRPQRTTVAELIMADVTIECIHACMLHHMPLKAVRRRKPATTDLTVILVVPSVNRKVPLQLAVS